MWNVDFLSVFPNVSVKDLNALERKFLEVLSYNVGMKASEYAKYYFDLRQRSTKACVCVRLCVDAYVNSRCRASSSRSSR